MFQGVKCVVQGADHIARGMICQDAADYKLSEHYAVAVVADGHGSAKYIRSDIGSKTAVRCAMETVDAYMADYELFSVKIRENSDYILRKMFQQFLARWTQAVEDYQDEHPLTEEENAKLAKAGIGTDNIYTFYGSTVLIAVMGEDFSYGLLVGDGGFVRIDEKGDACVPIDDKNSYANYVSSICSKNAVDALDMYFQEGCPLALCVSTDGLIKSFGCEQDFLDYHILLTPMLTNLERCQASMNKNFQKRTVSGSGDDISMAVVFKPEKIQAAQEMLRSRIEKNRAEKKARDEQERLARLKFQEEQQKKKQKMVQQSLDELEEKKRKATRALEEQKKRDEATRRKIEELTRTLTETEKNQQDITSYIQELDGRRFEKEAEHRQIQERRRALQDEQQDAQRRRGSFLESGRRMMVKLGDLSSQLGEKIRSPFEDDDTWMDEIIQEQMGLLQEMENMKRAAQEKLEELQEAMRDDSEEAPAGPSDAGGQQGEEE